MATDGPTPPPCDPEIVAKGEPVALLYGTPNAVERWVKSVAELANARVDWHYTGGIAEVLHLGDLESRRRVHNAIFTTRLTLEGTLIRELPYGSTGLYREGVTPTPDGAIAGFYDGSAGTIFMVQ